MISKELLNQLAWIGTEQVNGPVSGIVLRFPGLGSTGMKTDADAAELEWGQAGALTVIPYQDPWGWMNPRVVRFIDQLVEAIRAHHGLGDNVPLLSTGGSMGGHAALLYAIKSRHRVAACLANCPVCDLPFHYTERPDLPRTMHHAFDSYGDISALLREHSPLHQAAALPDVPYLILHGGQDQSVNKARHSDALVAALRQRGARVEYLELPQMRHCGPFDWPTSRKVVDFVLAHLSR